MQRDTGEGRQRDADGHSLDRGIGPCFADSLMGSKCYFCHSEVV